MRPPYESGHVWTTTADHPPAPGFEAANQIMIHGMVTWYLWRLPLALPLEPQSGANRLKK